MMPMRKSAFSRAIHDMALFHAFMSHYTTYFNVRFKTGDATESASHITMAARLVNDRLADPTQALTDETIATVACLGAYEVSLDGQVLCFKSSDTRVEHQWVKREHDSTYEWS